MTYDPDVAITLWPEYFDINLTRAQGRRLPKNLCVANPNLDFIAKGAMILDLEYEILEDRRSRLLYLLHSQGTHDPHYSTMSV